jgi:hypothetical protein
MFRNGLKINALSAVSVNFFGDRRPAGVVCDLSGEFFECAGGSRGFVTKV